MKRKLKQFMQTAARRKVYIEVITAALSVPMMLTILIINLNNLTGKKETNPTTSPTPAKQEVIIKTLPEESAHVAYAQETTDTASKENSPTPTPVSTATDCKKEVGPISIAYPTENQTIADDPITVIIKHDDDIYCSVVWSYRINGGTWSEYSSNSISLFSMPAGSKKIELRVQSTVSSDTDLIERNFMYQPKSDQTATNSAQ